MNLEESMEFLKEELKKIHPDVLSATADELIAAGFGGTDRCKIPGNWRDKAVQEKHQEVAPKGSKRCSCCRQIKPLGGKGAAFAKSSTSADGYQFYCKVCSKRGKA